MLSLPNRKLREKTQWLEANSIESVFWYLFNSYNYSNNLNVDQTF